MQRAITLPRRLLACRRGAALIGYTSLVLLLAIAAIAMLTHANGSVPTRNASSIFPS